MASIQKISVHKNKLFLGVILPQNLVSQQQVNNRKLSRRIQRFTYPWLLKKYIDLLGHCEKMSFSYVEPYYLQQILDRSGQ